MSRLGIQSLFTELLPIAAPDKQRKGRSETFDTERNERLIHRYLYYSITTGFRYEILIKIISVQFTISQRTVQNIMIENNARLRQVRGSLPTKKELEKRWPFLSWEAPELSYYI